MEETMKVAVVIGSAILIGLVGMAIKGVFGAFIGFVITLLIVGFFIIWKRYSNRD